MGARIVGVCRHCGHEGYIQGRGLCVSHYTEFVLKPIARGEKPGYDLLPRGGNRRKSDGNGLVKTFLPRSGDTAVEWSPEQRGRAKPRDVFGTQPITLEEVFWGHVCWLASSLGVPVESVPTFQDGLMLSKKDPRFRVAGNGDVVENLTALSEIVFDSVHPVVEFLTKTKERDDLLAKASDLDKEINAQLDTFLREDQNSTPV